MRRHRPASWLAAASLVTMGTAVAEVDVPDVVAPEPSASVIEAKRGETARPWPLLRFSRDPWLQSELRSTLRRIGLDHPLRFIYFHNNQPTP